MTQNNAKDTDGIEIRKHYYSSGALWGEIPYVNGKRHGIEKGYYESGDLMYKTPYVNGKMHGIEKNYDKDTININCLTLYNKDRILLSLRCES